MKYETLLRKFPHAVLVAPMLMQAGAVDEEDVILGNTEQEGNLEDRMMHLVEVRFRS